ncbi:MAG: DUF4838 domain-containing protein [Planctomycetes bacterium]|nr:DUF4838 domain-containing protein [Planctomycetota bacterium]
MSRLLAFVIVTFSLATEVAAADAIPPTPLLLAEAGVAQLPIIIADGASVHTRAAADELAAYLQRITGATFEVRGGDGSRGIVVGTLTEFPDDAFQRDLEIRRGRDGVEAFVIRTESQRSRLRLIGATELGTSHAVFHLLETIGCRWFFPSPAWEVVPSKPRLAVDVNESDRPKILSRRIWWGYGFFDRREGRCQAEYEAWARHNRMAQSRRIWCSHAWQSIIRDHQAEFDAHPEYLALVKDERRGPQFCVSNPAVRKIATDWALDQLTKDPECDMVSLEPSDGLNHCECENCRRLGNVSDRVFGLANEVARAVARDFPGKMVGLYAYSDHCEPPSFTLESNVYVQSTAGFIRGRFTFDELMELWPKCCRNMGFYEYFSVWLWDFDMPPGGRGANLDLIRQRICRYAELGATSVDCESGNNWGLHGRGYYVANRLMWNPDVDVDALLADFYNQSFGPAARVMQRYYERLDPGNAPLMSEHLLAVALRDLQEASRLAADRPDVLARLDHLKQYQHYVRLRWEHDRAEDRNAKKQLTIDALTHVYRTRYSYMNHWEAIRQSWARKAAEEFEEPSWADHPATGNPPWKQDAPFTREETETAFQDDLKRFQPSPIVEVEEMEFAQDVVPGEFRTEAPAESFQKYQGGARYALYSRDGEPLEMAITTGMIAWYRNRPDAAYSVTDAAGKKVAGGRLPQDGEAHPLQIEVPSAGLYWLDVDDQAAAWGLRVTAGRPASLALRRDTHPHHLGHMQRMYFYVPRGTRRIDYFWDGGPHTVLGPNGAVRAEVATKGTFVNVEVPPGTDGQVWSLSKLALGHLWFFNLPNYLAASPDALLVPRRLDHLAE